MKKWLYVALMLGAFMLMFSSNALAVQQDVKDVTGFISDEGVWMFKDLSISAARLEDSGETVIVKGVSQTDALKVILTKADAEYEYALFLVEGQVASTITRDNVIRFVSQKSGNLIDPKYQTLTFEVKPLLPENTTEQTLLIVSNDPNFQTVKIPIIYAQNMTIEYTLGQVTSGDDEIKSPDALLILQHAVGQVVLNGRGFLAADVNCDGDVNSADALSVLMFATGLIQTFD